MPTRRKISNSSVDYVAPVAINSGTLSVKNPVFPVFLVFRGEESPRPNAKVGLRGDSAITNTCMRRASRDSRHQQRAYFALSSKFSSFRPTNNFSIVSLLFFSDGKSDEVKI